MTVEQAAEAYSRMTGHSDDKQTFIDGAEWERQRDKWISVKDQLPPLDVKVIIAYYSCWDKVKKLYISLGTMVHHYGTIPTFVMFDGGLSRNEFVVQLWQPLPALPEPPKQKED